MHRAGRSYELVLPVLCVRAALRAGALGPSAVGSPVLCTCMGRRRPHRRSCQPCSRTPYGPCNAQPATRGGRTRGCDAARCYTRPRRSRLRLPTHRRVRRARRPLRVGALRCSAKRAGRLAPKREERAVAVAAGIGLPGSVLGFASHSQAVRRQNEEDTEAVLALKELARAVRSSSVAESGFSWVRPSGSPPLLRVADPGPTPLSVV